MFKKMSYETRFIVTLTIIFIGTLCILVMLNKYGLLTDAARQLTDKPKETTIIVTDAEKNAILSAIPKKVVQSMKEAAKQDSMSTAYLQLSRAPQGSKEYEELKHLIESDAKLKKRTGVTKVKETPSAPLRYLDKTSPRDRSSDAFYLYLVDVGGGVWPRFCVQTIAKTALKPNSFKISVKNRSFIFKPLVFKSEKLSNGIAEFYDEPLTPQLFSAMQAVVKTRSGTISITAGQEARTRTITEDEIKSLDRMMETYLALGGNLDLYKSAGSE